MNTVHIPMNDERIYSESNINLQKLLYKSAFPDHLDVRWKIFMTLGKTLGLLVKIMFVQLVCVLIDLCLLKYMHLNPYLINA